MDQDDDLLEPDEEVEEQIKQEEELEDLYGRSGEEPREKKMGPGFSKQKPARRDKSFPRRPKIRIVDRTK